MICCYDCHICISYHREYLRSSKDFEWRYRLKMVLHLHLHTNPLDSWASSINKVWKFVFAGFTMKFKSKVRMHFSVLMFETYTISILTTANSFAFYTFITKCRCLGAKSTLLWNCNTTPIRHPQKCGRSRTEIPSTNLGAYSMLVELVLERAFLVELLSHCQCASSDSVAHTLWPIELGVARSAIDAAIGSVVQIGRVQVFPALHAVETELVPHVLRALHLFRGEDHESASRTPVLRLLSVAIDGSPAGRRDPWIQTNSL